MKRKITVKESSPTAKGLELEINHAPPAFYPVKPPSTPPSKRIKTERTPPITPVKLEKIEDELKT
jgi:hypothetical protein